MKIILKVHTRFGIWLDLLMTWTNAQFKRNRLLIAKLEKKSSSNVHSKYYRSTPHEKKMLAYLESCKINAKAEACAKTR